MVAVRVSGFYICFSALFDRPFTSEYFDGLEFNLETDAWLGIRLSEM